MMLYFIVKSKSNSVTGNIIHMQTEIITKKAQEELIVKDGNVLASPEKDLWKVAAFDRTFGSGKHAIGFLKNFWTILGDFAPETRPEIPQNPRFDILGKACS